MGVPEHLRDVCLIWDEVNLIGQVRLLFVSCLLQACDRPLCAAPAICPSPPSLNPPSPQLAFAVVGNKYRFFGMVDDARTNICFKPPRKEPKTTEERIRALKATHLLVMQAAFIHDLSSYSKVCTRPTCTPRACVNASHT